MGFIGYIIGHVVTQVESFSGRIVGNGGSAGVLAPIDTAKGSQIAGISPGRCTYRINGRCLFWEIFHLD
jgi:hypothetical protein